METFFTRNQTAKLLDLKTPETLDRWRERGYGPAAYRASNGRIYYKIDEVREWALQQPAVVEKFPAEDAANNKDKTPA